MTSAAAHGFQTRSIVGHASVPLRASAFGDDDDKYAKVNGQKCNSVSDSFSIRDINSKDVAAFMRSPLQVYLVFLMAGSCVYYLLGGNLVRADAADLLGYLSTICETLGLLVLHYKIKAQRSVKGISGMTMTMYAIVFVSREYLLMPECSLLFIDGWAVEILQLPSMFITFGILYSIFDAHKDTYQMDLDVLSFRYIVPTCVALAIVLHPHFVQGEWHSFLWTAYMYLDVCSLLPQVVMMARSTGMVEAPIAHFVAATALRWVIDLWFWYFDFDLGPQGWYKGINVSGCLIVAFHILSLCLVADFMYYYIKARFSGSKFSDDLDVGVPIEV